MGSSSSSAAAAATAADYSYATSNNSVADESGYESSSAHSACTATALSKISHITRAGHCSASTDSNAQRTRLPGCSTTAATATAAGIMPYIKLNYDREINEFI